MAMNIDTKFEEKLTFVFKADMRNLGNFHQNTWKSQNWGFDRIFLSKVEMSELKIYKEFFCYDNEKRYRIGRSIYFRFQIDMGALKNFGLSTWKS